MRPQYHYAPAANWLSDPNGLVYHTGEWHLFYQYNPEGEGWGHMSWGHAISPDLAAWTELPVAIAETAADMIFSGSAVIDHAGSAGFGHDAMVAIYTAAARHGPQRQSQALAHSSDSGRSFVIYSGNPVIDLEMADFRDPNVFWHDPTQRWIMVVVLSNENRALIYASKDLRQWDEMSEISGTNAPGRIWECPLLIELPVEGTGTNRWLFKVDVLHDAPGSGALYQTGTFDGVRFAADGPQLEPLWQVADHGRDFYAAIAWHEPRDAMGRPAWIGWMGNHAYQGQLPLKGWRGAMSLPRRLSLIGTGGQYRLRQEVEPAVAARAPELVMGTAGLALVGRLCLPASERLDWTASDSEGRVVRIERSGDQLLVSRQVPQLRVLDAVCQCTVDPDQALELWFDHGSIEVFSGNGGTAMTLQV